MSSTLSNPHIRDPPTLPQTQPPLHPTPPHLRTSTYTNPPTFRPTQTLSSQPTYHPRAASSAALACIAMNHALSPSSLIRSPAAAVPIRLSSFQSAVDGEGDAASCTRTVRAEWVKWVGRVGIQLWGGSVGGAKGGMDGRTLFWAIVS